MVRISLTNTSGARRSRRASSASNAATACSRPTKNSLWSSSPWLGVWSRRKWGSRSSQGPGTPSCSVHASGGRSPRGWSAVVARLAPNRSDRRAAAVIPVRDPALAPHLVDDRPAPPREQAHAVARRGERVEVVAQRGDRQALVHVLPDAVRRLDRERQARDDTQRAQRDHRPGERVAVRLAAERDELAVGPDQLHRHDGGGQVPQPVARPVRRGRAGAGHRDVGQGRQVVEREAGSLRARAPGRRTGSRRRS